MTINDLMSLDEMKEALKKFKLYVVAKHTNISYPTIKKIADGKDENYTLKILTKLSNYLKM